MNAGELHVEWVGPEAGRRALIAHGILGMGRNWRSMARRMVSRLPGWRFALVDLRHHGRSQGFGEPHTVAAAAADLADLADRDGAFDVAIGHSFGGKVVLEWLLGGADLSQTWVLDAPPGRRPSAAALDTVGVLASLRSAPVPAPDRQTVRAHLLAAGLAEPLVQWLLTSLVRSGEQWRWVWDLDAIDAMLADYLDRDYTDALARWQGSPIELVRAGRSDRWLPGEVAAIETLPADHPVDLHLLSNAGHWVHVDDPAGLLDLLATAWIA